MGRFLVAVSMALLLISPVIKADGSLIDIPRRQAQQYLDIIQLEFQELLQDIFVGQKYRDVEEAAAIASISRSLNAEAITYWLLDTPRDISKDVALRTLSLTYSIITGDASVVLINSLEDLSVKQAQQVAMDWLRDYNVQSISGRLRATYRDYAGSTQKPEIEYIMVYRPEGSKRGHITAEFRSLVPIPPPNATSRNVWDATSWLAAGRKELRPFLITIDGQIQDRNGFCEWSNQPDINVEFPNTVVSISPVKESGFWGGLFGGVGSWVTKQIEKLSAWLSPTPEQNSWPINNSEITELKQAVSELQEIVDKNENIESVFDLQLTDLIEGLSSAAVNLAGISEENKIIGEEMAKIAHYSAEIMKWQAESTHNPSTSSPKIDETDNLEEDTADNPDNSPEDDCICSTKHLSLPTHYPVILNESAWMGRTASANHEWIELRNLSDETIALSGWQLFNQNQNLLIVFDEEDIIAPRGFFLLVRTSDNNVPEATADHVYTGALKNHHEAIYLFNQDCQLQDFVQAQPDWPSGDEESKRTMERRNNLEWQTSLYYHGTPKRTNSSGYWPSSETSVTQEKITDTQVPTANAGPDQVFDYNEPILIDASLSGDNVGIVAYRWDTNNDGLFNQVLTSPVLELPAGYLAPGDHTMRLEVADAAENIARDSLVITIRPIPKILLNEIQFHGQTNRDEFIELFNPNPDDINLAGWSLRKKTSGGNESTLVSGASFKGTIAAHDYFLIATAQTEEDGTSKYQGTVSPDLYYSGQSYYFASDNTILLYGPDGSIVDLVGYGQAQDYDGQPFPENPPPGLSLGRFWNDENEIYSDTNNNSFDFQWQNPTPGQPNQAWQSSSDESNDQTDETIQDGSMDFPFLLSSCEDLLMINDHLGSFYQLTTDIDCTVSQSWNDGRGFIPIGQEGSFPFVGQLDGQNHSISGIHVVREEGGGLFWQLKYPAKIINLRLEEVLVESSADSIGLLTNYIGGESSDNLVVIDHVFVEGQIVSSHDKTNAPQSVGGLAGQARHAVVTNSRVQIDIEANQRESHSSSRAGGLFGLVDYSEIRNCSARGQIIGWRNIGGLIGRTDKSVIIQENYASVDIIGHSTLGGFIGHAWSSLETLVNNYATGSVQGCSEEGNEIGGFIGLSNSWIDNSYSIGPVYGLNSYGFIGDKAAHRTDPIRNSYYDINTSGRSGCYLGSEGLTTVEMKQEESFTDWDFETVWIIDNDYPILRRTP